MQNVSSKIPADNTDPWGFDSKFYFKDIWEIWDSINLYEYDHSLAIYFKELSPNLKAQFS